MTCGRIVQGRLIVRGRFGCGSANQFGKLVCYTGQAVRGIRLLCNVYMGWSLRNIESAIDTFSCDKGICMAVFIESVIRS